MPLKLNTLSPMEAGKKVFDIIVIGAGPAGSLAARQAAILGASVLLLDRADFPRHKVCGCCLNGLALSTLRQSGLGNLVADGQGVPLTHLHLCSGRCQAEIGLPSGLALSRELLDTELIASAMSNGVSFVPGVFASVLSLEGNVRLVRLGDTGSLARARVVIAADGLGGRCLDGLDGFDVLTKGNSRVGVGSILPHGPAFYRPGIIYMLAARGGYVGLVRLEDYRLNVAAALDLEFSRSSGGPGKAIEKVMAEHDLPVPDHLDQVDWRGTVGLTRRRRRPAGERLLVIGDSASYAEPFTGEGIAWAFLSAVAAAPLAVSGAGRWAATGEKWAGTYENLIERRQNFSRMVSTLLRKEGLTRNAVWLLSKMPALASPVVHHLNVT